jgi:streptogramin lyase
MESIILRFIFLFYSACAFSISSVMQNPGVKNIHIDNKAIAKLHVQGYPDFIITDENAVWVTNVNRIEKLISGSDTVVKSISIPEPCGAGAEGFGSLWVASCQDKSIYRIDKKIGVISNIIHTGLAEPTGELSIAVGAGSVWVLNQQGILARIDPTTNSIVNYITVSHGSYCAAFGFGAVWVTNSENVDHQGSVQRIDPVSNRVVATIPVGPKPHFLAAGEGGVWTLNQGDGTVTQVDPDTNTAVRSIDVHAVGTGGDIATGANRVWVRVTTVLLSEIDPVTGEVLATYGPNAGSGAVRVTGDGVVWLSAHDVETVWALKN